MSRDPAIHCRRCAHYRVTWDPQFPHGCRAFGIRSRHYPCLEVAAASALRCRLFTAKPPGKPCRRPLTGIDKR